MWTSLIVTSEAGELQGSCLTMFDKTHCDQRSNNDWQDSLLVLVDEYLVDFLLKDKGVVEHCLRSCPRQVQEVHGTGDFSFEIVEQRRVD